MTTRETVLSIGSLFGPLEKKRKGKTPEGKVKDAVVAALKLRKEAWVWNNATGTLPAPGGGYVSYGKKGSGDLIGMLRLPSGIAAFLSIETKALKGKEAEHQAEFRLSVNAMGGCAIVVKSAVEALAGIDAFLARHR